MTKAESKYFNTARKMDEALIALLEQKPFEYITIKELCDQAQVNRSTFYLHYENTRDLLEETTAYLIDTFLSYFSSDTASIVNHFSTCDLFRLNFISEEYLSPYLSYIKNNRRVFSTALTHTITFGFDRIYQQMFEHIFDPILDRFHYPQEHRSYVMLFYLNGIHAIISKWLNENCERSVEDISSIISECIFGQPALTQAIQSPQA